jgi:hypothetical protein
MIKKLHIQGDDDENDHYVTEFLKLQFVGSKKYNF